MSFAVTRLLRVQSLAQVTARRGILSKPARTPSSPAESTFGFSAFMVCALVPSGWILSHLQEYKKRD